MAGNGRPIIPGQMAIETTFAAGPLAQPAVVTVPTPGQLKILAIGGLSKVEALAGQVAAAFVGTPGAGYESDVDAVEAGNVAARAVTLAVAILAECERLMVAAQEHNSQSPIEGA